MASKKSVPKTKKQKKLLPRLALLILAAYSFFLLVDMQVSLSEKSEELAVLEQQQEYIRIENKDLQRQISNGVDEEEIERVAREQLDYVAPNEKVFIDISGS